MADSGDAPDWFGNVINNWIALFLHYVITGVSFALFYAIAWTNLFGMQDTWAGISRGMLPDLLPPIPKKAETWSKEFKNPGKPYWA